MARTPISKKVRFEIFKRDGFTCQYCGNHPPKVILEVDHIVPVFSGGDNDDTNLVTACFDCNRGKAARALSVVPQSLAEKASEVAEREAQLQGCSEIMEAQRRRIDADVWAVFRHWRGQSKTTHDKFNSVKMFIGRLGLYSVYDAVDIAMAKGGSENSEWKYFCGVCWGKIRDAEQ